MFDAFSEPAALPQPFVQPIAVLKTGTHLDTITAAAIASTNLLEVRDHTWDKWLDGRFTKSVRRASAGDLGRLLRWADDEGIPHRHISRGGSRAVALPPMPYDKYPKVLSKMQVSGTDFERADPEEGPEPSDVSVLVLDTLTTGKAAAQAAHALMTAGVALIQENDSGFFSDLRTGWERALNPVVQLVSADSLDKFSHEPSWKVITDSGLTEIEPGTVTAAITWADLWSR